MQKIWTILQHDGPDHLETHAHRRHGSYKGYANSSSFAMGEFTAVRISLPFADFSLPFRISLHFAVRISLPFR